MIDLDLQKNKFFQFRKVREENHRFREFQKYAARMVNLDHKMKKIIDFRDFEKSPQKKSTRRKL